MKKVLFYLFISHLITFNIKNSQEAADFAPLGQKKIYFENPRDKNKNFVRIKFDLPLTNTFLIDFNIIKCFFYLRVIFFCNFSTSHITSSNKFQTEYFFPPNVLQSDSKKLIGFRLPNECFFNYFLWEALKEIWRWSHKLLFETQTHLKGDVF